MRVIGILDNNQLAHWSQATSRRAATLDLAGGKRQASSVKLDSWENIGYKVFGPSSPDSRAMWQWMVPNKGERHMAQSYPIWIDVSGDNYKTSKSFGSKDHVALDIKVGSSKTYSNDLARVSIHMREDAAGNRTFALALDGLVVRSAVMTKDKKFWHRDPKAA